MTEEMKIRYAIRGLEDELLDWGEKKRAVMCLKKEETEDKAEEGGISNTELDRMIAGIDLEMEALKKELDGLKAEL